ncbi:MULTISPECIES: MerR family transcriptional regulator [unclassified Nostoc]|uniref:MerR family transcriptional regulator n=1 Tax=unclassified Nostoc TaxID=2593658 RepID=UPI001CB962ED|nr:MerR family transcriptional regulator [Nostoc sp. 'Peltigera membranacea cyanobiont' 232]
MQETFFTSKEAAEITGCTLRQLQYWRERGVIVPVISDTGTGRSIYYSKSNLLELAAMSYWLSVGLSFDIASTTLKKLKDQEPELFTSGKGKRFMLLSQAQERSPSGFGSPPSTPSAEKFGGGDLARAFIEADHQDAIKNNRQPIVRYYVPHEYRWDAIRFHPKDGLGEFITTAMREVANRNPGLSGTLTLKDYNEKQSN